MSSYPRKIVKKETIKDLLPSDFTPNKLDLIEQELWDGYCSSSAISRAASGPDSDFHTSLIRLRDFVSVKESYRTTSLGDIGGLIKQYFRFAILAQGITGMRHYRTHIPNLLLKICGPDLPPDLQSAIQKTFLVSPSGRPGHFVSQDFLMETYNYTLKYLFGTKVGPSRLSVRAHSALR